MLDALFRRWRRTGTPAERPAAPGPSRTDSGGPVAPAEWSGLPPMPRALGPHPLTADTVGFARGLTVRTGPELILQKPEHSVALVPAGYVRGLATLVARNPAASAGAGERHGSQLVQRLPREPGRAPAQEQGLATVPRAARSLPVAAPAAPSDASAWRATEPAPDPGVVAEDQRPEAAPVASSPEAGPGAAPAEALPEAGPGAGLGHNEPSEAVAPLDRSPLATGDLVGRRGLGRPVARGDWTPPPARAGDATGGDAVPPSTGTSAPASSRLGGQVQRSGEPPARPGRTGAEAEEVGTPMAQAAPSDPAGRSDRPSPAMTSAGVAAAAFRRIGPPATIARSTWPGAPWDPASAGGPAANVPGTPPPKTKGAAAPAAEPPQAGPSGPAQPVPSGSALVATGPARPMPGLTVELAPTPATATAAADPVPGAPAAAGRRAPPAGTRPVGAGGQTLVARRAAPLVTRPSGSVSEASTSAPAVVVRRSDRPGVPAAPGAGPAAAWPGRGWADAGETVGPTPVLAAQYVARSEEPADHAGDAGDAGIAAGVGRREPDGSVVFTPPSGAGSATAPGLLRQAAEPATGSTEPARPGMAPADPADPASLADDLYERVERRLRAELLLDRERKGLLADLGGLGS